MKKTTSQFIKDAQKIHGDKYDYTKVEYDGVYKKVCIICPEHGEFWMTPNNHLNGQGCPKCKNKNVTTSEFIEKAKKIHGDKYNYSKTKYHKATEKICIVCPIHGEFWMTPNAHLNGQGCRFCSGLKFNKDIFVQKSKEIYKNKYDYTKVVYTNNRTKVCIICPEHGEFWQTPKQHLNGSGCPKCRKGHHKIDTEEFLEKCKSVHGEEYTYDRLVFNKMSEKVTITCKKHGDFKVFPENFIKGCGCPECNKSSIENRLSNFLVKHNIEFIFQKKFSWLKNKKPLSLDFFLPEYNVAIECQGEHHLIEERCFKNRKFEDQVQLDKIKNELCDKHNIKILYYGFQPFSKIDKCLEIYNESNYFSSLIKLFQKFKY